MRYEFLHIALGAGIFLAAIFVLGFECVKAGFEQKSPSNSTQLNRSFSPWYLASMKSAAVFAVIMPLIYMAFGMAMTNGQVEIFSVVLGFMVAAPIGLTYDLFNSFILRHTALSPLGRFALGFIAGQLAIVLPMLSYSIRTTIGLLQPPRYWA